MSMIQARSTGGLPMDASDTAFVVATSVRHGTEAMLHAQAVLLDGLETMAFDWLRRRQEAVSDVQQLFGRLRTCRDMAAVWDAQREWLESIRARLAADVSIPLATAALWINGAAHGGEAEASASRFGTPAAGPERDDRGCRGSTPLPPRSPRSPEGRHEDRTGPSNPREW